MYSCPVCSLDIFLPKIIGTPEFYQELQGDAQQKYYEDDKWEFTELLKDTQQAGSLLEIGCGPGNFLEKAKTRISKVAGIEYNKDATLAARKKGLEVVDLTEENTLRKASFDIVASFHVLEHVDDPVGFLQKMESWMKNTGRLVISVPNQDGPLRYINPCFMNMPPHHATRWHKKTFEVLAEKQGLKIDKIGYEPLLLVNHSYYSYYWVHAKIRGDSWTARFTKGVLNRGLTVFFVVLSKIWKYFPLLRGQSMYVVMSRRG